MIINIDGEIGHGCFFVTGKGQSFSHSHKELNDVKINFKYDWGDEVRVETHTDELLFVN